MSTEPIPPTPAEIIARYDSLQAELAIAIRLGVPAVVLARVIASARIAWVEQDRGRIILAIDKRPGRDSAVSWVPPEVGPQK